MTGLYHTELLETEGRDAVCLGAQEGVVDLSPEG